VLLGVDNADAAQLELGERHSGVDADGDADGVDGVC
jgi:hypothetical protein